ncbi:hypothetical protein F5B21DRAFT_527514 [Xylaria acuta]|nr:hypothetical protein F5B21DRAFT_527514 [Xylaria acuta]
MDTLTVIIRHQWFLFQLSNLKIINMGFVLAAATTLVATIQPSQALNFGNFYYDSNFGDLETFSSGNKNQCVNLGVHSDQISSVKIKGGFGCDFFV